MWWETMISGQKSAEARVVAATTASPISQRSQTIFPPRRSWRPACPRVTRVATANVRRPIPETNRRCRLATRSTGQSAAPTQPSTNEPAAQRTAVAGVVPCFARRNTGVSQANHTRITAARSQ